MERFTWVYMTSGESSNLVKRANIFCENKWHYSQPSEFSITTAKPTKFCETRVKSRDNKVFKEKLAIAEPYTHESNQRLGKQRRLAKAKILKFFSQKKRQSTRKA